jgi:hypothetical protein
MPSKPLVVLINPYEVQVGFLDGRVVSLTPDEAQALVINLVAAIRTVTRPTAEAEVVH